MVVVIGVGVGLLALLGAALALAALGAAAVIWAVAALSAWQIRRRVRRSGGPARYGTHRVVELETESAGRRLRRHIVIEGRSRRL